MRRVAASGPKEPAVTTTSPGRGPAAQAGDVQLPPLARIAERAGVSVATVSKVLNGRPGIAPATRTRVRVALDSMGAPMTPRRPRRSGLVDIRLDNLSGAWSQEALRGAVGALREQGRDVVVSVGAPTECDAWIRSALARGSGGLIVFVGVPSGPVSALAREAGVPLVVVDPWHQTLPDITTVTCANFRGASDAVAHLIGLGHRRIAAVGGPTTLENARERLAGYRAAHLASGLACDIDLIRSGDYSVASGYQAGQYFLGLAEPPTAVFAASDDAAVGVIRAYREAGWRVPGDVSVVGFDDLPGSRWQDPPLTTVTQPVAEMAVVAALRVMEDQETRPALTELPTRLIIRETTAPPPQGRRRSASAVQQ